MHIRLKVSALFVCVICLNCFYPLVSFSKDSQETVQLTAGPWPPFTSEDLPHYGSATRIVTEAFALEGIKVEYMFRPWKRAFMEANRGKYDGSILWRRTSEREKNFYYSSPVILAEVVFFHLKKYPFDWKSLNDLKKNKVRIGLVRGFKYGNEFDTAIKAGELISEDVTTQEMNLHKLLKRRINITPIVKESGYTTISREFSPEEAALFTHHSVPLAKHMLHLILSKKIKKNQRILELFNKGLEKMKKTEN